MFLALSLWCQFASFLLVFVGLGLFCYVLVCLATFSYVFMCVFAVFCVGLVGFGGECGLVEEVFMARVVADGRVTVPKHIREFLGIEVGDYVRVAVTQVIKTKKKKKTKS